MNIVEAMEHVKRGDRVRLGSLILKANAEGKLMRDNSREYKLQKDAYYTPTQEEMLSDDWELVTDELPNGAIVRICETDLVVHTGYRGRRYLVNTYSNEIIFEYENEELMLIDIDRRGGELVWC